MRYFYDTEFLEDGRTIDLISIGIVAEDGREYYAVNSDMPQHRVKDHSWLMANVWPTLPTYVDGDTTWINPEDAGVKPREVIARDVASFLRATSHTELWAWYGAYDHVVLCQLWGTMMQLPAGIPMWTNDLRQEVARLGDPKLPDQASCEHNALEDARHLAVRFAAAGVT